MKKNHLILLILVIAILGIIISTITDAGTYENFTTAAQTRKTIQVVGYLNKNKPFEYNPAKDVNQFVFYMFDKDSIEKKVIFQGSKPQDFERSEQIVVTGRMENDVFMAEKILMKCPSKYNNGASVEVTESTQKRIP